MQGATHMKGSKKKANRKMSRKTIGCKPANHVEEEHRRITLGERMQRLWTCAPVQIDVSLPSKEVGRGVARYKN